MSEMTRPAELGSATAAAGQIIRDATVKLAEDFRRPEFRAGFAAAMVTTALLARSGARPGLAIFTAIMTGAAVEHLYGMALDIHEKVTGDAAGPV